MRRREFVVLAASAAVIRPGSAMAETKSLPVVGFLNSGVREPIAQQVAAFIAGLAEGGFVEGHNVAVEYRYGKLVVRAYDPVPGVA